MVWDLCKPTSQCIWHGSKHSDHYCNYRDLDFPEPFQLDFQRLLFVNLFHLLVFDIFNHHKASPVFSTLGMAISISQSSLGGLWEWCLASCEASVCLFVLESPRWFWLACFQPLSQVLPTILYCALGRIISAYYRPANGQDFLVNWGLYKGVWGSPRRQEKKFSFSSVPLGSPNPLIQSPAQAAMNNW